MEITARAEADLVLIAEWYQERHPGGYDRFLNDFTTALGVLRSFPRAGRERGQRPGLRSYPVFPFIVFYTVSDEQMRLTIIAAVHGHMDIESQDIP